MKSVQYRAIDIWKMILAIIIAIYHYNYAYGLSYPYLFPGGYICVDAFFTISGFFLMKSIVENPNAGIFRFIWKRIKPESVALILMEKGIKKYLIYITKKSKIGSAWMPMERKS